MTNGEAERLIHALLKDFTRCVDHGPAERLPLLFTEDGVFEVPEVRAIGRVEIQRGALARVAKQRISRHVMTNVEVLVADGAAIASGRGIVTVYRHDGEGTGDTLPSSIFDFEDRYRLCEDGQWRFVERRMLRIFARTKS